MTQITKGVMLFIGVALTCIPLWMAIHARTTAEAAILGYLSGCYGILSIRISEVEES